LSVVAASVLFTIPVLENDYDVDGDAFVIIAVSAPQHGVASWATGNVTYTPNHDYAGADTFTYTISDNRGATATATVAIAAEILHIYLPVLAAPGALPFNY
jgi:hypothetical protein